MHPENGDWILIQGSDLETIRAAVVKHSKLARHEQPSSHRVSLFQLDAEQYGVRFDPMVPPYAFANLIGWLDDPRMTAGAVFAVGWIASPGTGVRYYLAPRRPNAGGDTLIGQSEDGTSVTVYLPDCGLRRAKEGVEPLPEPLFEPGAPLVEFEIEADADRSFGNPDFV